MKVVNLSSSILGLLTAAIVAFVPSVASAHEDASQTDGFAIGFAHPVTGLDHICAMVAVGLWAAQLGGRALWTVPLTFVSVMSVGTVLGMLGTSNSIVEPGIIASVLLFGMLIAGAVRLPPIACGIFVGLFALLHGHAHGTEMPETVMGLAYGIGLVTANGLLLGFGIGLCLLAQRFATHRAIRFAGGIIVAFGLYLALPIN